MPVQEQVVVIFAGVRGYIDDVPVEDVQRFESELRAFMRAGHGEMLAEIASTGKLPRESDLEAAIKEFRRGFGSSSAPSSSSPSSSEGVPSRAAPAVAETGAG
jgi:F-type H+-transporting ATPase subunit alpha